MAYVPINRARALIIRTRPQDYAPTRVYAAASYLETLANATAEELGLAKNSCNKPDVSYRSESPRPRRCV